MFKRAPDGYIFQPPPPTIFARTSAYHVNEVQKAEILTIMRAHGGRLRRSVFGALVLAITAGALIGVVGVVPVFVSIPIALCVCFIALMAGTALVHHMELRRLEPILVDLRRSDERLFFSVNVDRPA